MLGSPDAALLRRAIRGDQEAVTSLFALIQPGVVRYCRARLGRADGAFTNADDVAQEVCLAVYRALPSYRDQGRPFAAFVYGIAARKVADVYRVASRRPSVTNYEVLPERADPAAGPEEHALTADLSRRLSRLLAELPERQREIIVLRVAVGLSSAEVGSVLGMSAVSVRVHQSRALQRLRTLAGEAFAHDSAGRSTFGQEVLGEVDGVTA